METMMGMLMNDAQKQGTAYARNIEPAQFSSMPVFFSRSYCPICRTELNGLRGKLGWTISPAHHASNMLDGSERTERRCV